MTEKGPIVPSEPATAEERREWEELDELFAELEKKQLEFLDEAGKRVAELSATLLGILFAVVAFGDTFPPPYLTDALARGLALLVLVAYLLALLTAVFAIRPRDYRRFRREPKAMRDELKKIVSYKSRGIEIAGALFVLATILLAALVGLIICPT